MNAEMGTPSGASNLGEIPGHWIAGAVKRLFGCAAGSLVSGVQGRPRQSVRPAGGVGSRPSHHGHLSAVIAVLVKIEFFIRLASAFGFVFALVPGATPKKPASGLIAQSLPSGPTRSHAMSSPTVHTFHPGCDGGGTRIARLVLPHEIGRAHV